MKYRKKPVVIEATQWFEQGDHDKVSHYVDYNRDLSDNCSGCDKPLEIHGFIATLEGHHIVCPGDWIITGAKGEHYPCKPDIFDMTYEKVEGVKETIKEQICETCKKKPGKLRIDNGLKAGVHCDKCWDDMITECRSKSW